MEQLIDARLAPLHEGQRNTAKILSRFEVTLAGIPEAKLEGLAAKVDRHDDIIVAWKTQASEIKGAVSAAIGAGKWFVGLFTILHIGFDFWLVFHGK